jgi:four helix bundle protein
MLGFQRLDAYLAATEFLGVSFRLAAGVPGGHDGLVDQLRRAAMAIPLNIAQGSARGGGDAARFYAIARGSALECGAILDALEAMAVFNEAELTDARALLARIVSILTTLMRP